MQKCIMESLPFEGNWRLVEIELFGKKEQGEAVALWRPAAVSVEDGGWRIGYVYWSCRQPGYGI
jgi:hypothetical protein